MTAQATGQLSLPFTIPPIQRVSHKPRTLREQFNAFHEGNPGVYQSLRRLALDMQRQGVRQYGIKGLFEILRWQYALQTQGEPYKLNNNYTAHYARLLMESEPSLMGFFETRARQRQ